MGVVLKFPTTIKADDSMTSCSWAKYHERMNALLNEWIDQGIGGEVMVHVLGDAVGQLVKMAPEEVRSMVLLDFVQQAAHVADLSMTSGPTDAEGKPKTSSH